MSPFTASAGPPHGICRDLSAERCELALGPYGAYAFLQHDTISKLRARQLDPRGGGGECGTTVHRGPRFYRCKIAIVTKALATPCVVEALIYERKHHRFEFRWRHEGRYCKA
jgi:hypothetical protein